MINIVTDFSSQDTSERNSIESVCVRVWEGGVHCNLVYAVNFKLMVPCIVIQC